MQRTFGLIFLFLCTCIAPQYLCAVGTINGTVTDSVTGEKLVVRESLEEVLELVHEFHIHSQRRIAPGFPAEPGTPEPNPATPENPRHLGRAEKEKP